jgi:aryl-alcohol dehydrogenase-like predicted oxidoreductase
MGLVHLEHDAAMQKMHTVEDAVKDVKQRKDNMHADAMDMLQSHWMGDKARLFGQKMEEHQGDLQDIVNSLDEAVGTARDNMRQTFELG